MIRQGSRPEAARAAASWPDGIRPRQPRLLQERLHAVRLDAQEEHVALLDELQERPKAAGSEPK